MAITEVASTQCGWCNDGNHSKCAVGTKFTGGRHEKYPNGVVWVCRCTSGGCTPGRRKCAYCGNRETAEVSPDTWECVDTEYCRALVEERREANPFTHQLREIKETVNMAKIQENQAKAEKVAKTKEPTFCLVTGEPTKGGLFKPGMDARYVSLRVASVVEANFTAKAEKAARDQMKKDGVSEALVGKFDKSLTIAKDKAEKRAAAEAEKKAAKAEKAAAKG